MEFQCLDVYCLNLIYEVEASRNLDAAIGRPDAHERRRPRKRRGLLPVILEITAALRNVRSAFGPACELRNPTRTS
jgi:hypothetical protein